MLLKPRIISSSVFLILIICANRSTSVYEEKPADPSSEQSSRIKLEQTIGYGDAHFTEWSPDGNYLAVASSTGIWLYDIYSSELTYRLLGDDLGNITHITFSRDSSILGAASSENLVAIFSLADDQSLEQIELESSVLSMTISQDASTIYLSTSDSKLHIWQWNAGQLNSQNLNIQLPVIGLSAVSEDKLLLTTRRSLHILETPNGSETMVQTFSNSVIPIATSENRIALVELDTGLVIIDSPHLEEELFELEYIFSLTFEEEFSMEATSTVPVDVDFRRNIVALGHRSGLIELVNLVDKSTISLDTQETSIQAVKFDPKGKLVSTVSYGDTINIWDIGKESLLHRIEGFSEPIHVMAIHPETGLIATATDNGNGPIYEEHLESVIHIWDINLGDRMITLRGHSGGVTSLAFNSDGKLLFSTSRDQTIKIWETINWREMDSIDAHGHEVIAIAYDNDIFATAGSNGQVMVWNSDFERLFESESPNLNLRNAFLEFSPDRKQLAFGSSNQLRVWDAASWNLLSAIDVASIYPLSDIAFTPDSRQLLATTAGGNILLWNTAVLNASNVYNVESGLRCLVALDNENFIIGTDDGAMLLWNIEQQSLLESVTGHNGQIWDLEYLPDKNQLVSAGQDGTIKIWRIN